VKTFLGVFHLTSRCVPFKFLHPESRIDKAYSIRFGSVRFKNQFLFPFSLDDLIKHIHDLSIVIAFVSLKITKLINLVLMK
jgi:hypothetical protein